MLKFILYATLQKIILSSIKMPFSTYHSPSIPNNKSDPSYVKFLSENNIYSFLIIGTPPQKIVTKINFNEYSFNIYNNQCVIPSEFNSENPISQTRKDLGFLLTDVYVDTFLNEDLFILEESKNITYNLSYIYAPMNNNEFEDNIPKYPYTCANIGLKLSSDIMEAFKYNFLRELKASNIIDNYVFYIEYNEINDNQGNLIVGKKPHELNNKYKFFQFKETYAVNMKIELYWMLRFDSIFIKQKNEENNKIVNFNNTNYDATIEHNLNIIFGTSEYLELIEKEYFKEKIKKNLCKKNYIAKKIINFDCESFNDIKDFPNLYFDHKILEYTFEINYKDIFMEINGRVICLIWFDENKMDKWRFGKSFLKKYLFTFDLDRKSIGFYNTKINEEDGKKNNKDEKGINNFYIFIIIIVLSLIAFFLCYLFAKKIYSNKNVICEDKKTTELINVNEKIIN